MRNKIAQWLPTHQPTDRTDSRDAIASKNLKQFELEQLLIASIDQFGLVQLKFKFYL